MSIFKLYNKKQTKPISPLQRWSRRRNWEKGQLEYFHKELTFRLNARWMKTDKRSQTQTDDEVNKLRAITLMLKDMLEDWNENTVKSKLSIKFR